MLETRSVYAVDLEIRQDGERPVIAGRFPYGGLAIIGTRRQERFLPGAFKPSLDVDKHEINFLLSHDMARPLASRNAGTLTLVDSPEALTFEATCYHRKASKLHGNVTSYARAWSRTAERYLPRIQRPSEGHESEGRS